MKITLILLISKLVSNNSKYLLLKIIIILFIPSILTYLEPDTGVIILYFVITLSILYLYGINKKYIIFFIITCTLIVSIIISLYFINKNILINILGPNIFYRLERLFNFANGTGYQLENSLIVISSSGLFGHGINNIPLYFPESSTDFIFTSYSSIFGLFGNIIFILFILIFNISLISLLKKDLKLIDKYIIIGILGMISYQQFQNISMTIGLLPITGITLPFISYGGSSLFSYMIILGIIFRIIADRKRSIN